MDERETHPVSSLKGSGAENPGRYLMSGYETAGLFQTTTKTM